MAPESTDNAHHETDIEEHVRDDDRGRCAGERQDLPEGQSDDHRGQDERDRDDREQSPATG